MPHHTHQLTYYEKKETNSQSAFLYLRVSIGVLLVLAGVALTLLGIGQFPAHAQQRNSSSTAGINPLVPAGFDCAQFYALGYHIQENLRAGAIAIYCGQAIGGSPDAEGAPMSFAEELLAPLLGGTDVDLISPQTDAGTHITQSETFVSANPDNPNTIVVAYNDSRNVAASPINISSASVSSDGGATFTRLTKANGHSPFENTLGDPVVLYNSASGTFFTVWLDIGCGGRASAGISPPLPRIPIAGRTFASIPAAPMTVSLATPITSPAARSMETCKSPGTTSPMEVASESAPAPTMD